MIDIEELLRCLKESMEAKHDVLKNGQLFLPKGLKGKVFVNQFHVVIEMLAKRLGLRLRKEVRNNFPPAYEMNHQRIDYVLGDNKNEPAIFLELESLDRAQLYLFSDGSVNNDKAWSNKLWYYHGTLSNYYSMHAQIPRYFIFLLILPDQEVERYPLWDTAKDFQLYDAVLRETVFKSPYKFYDRQIKSHARAFLRNNQYVWDGHSWLEKPLGESHDKCELVFITCTGDRLILSRGKDLFDPTEETVLSIKWSSSMSKKGRLER